MIKSVSSKIRLGMFVSVGMAIFIVGIYFIGQGRHLFRSTFRISGVFEDVGGLQVGNNVRLSGINVGTVDNIQIVSDTSVRVSILIDERTRKYIKKDAVASIGSEGLMGNKILIISPGTGGKREIENNDTITTSVPASIDDILISLKTTVDNVAGITGDLGKIAEVIQSGKGTLGKLLMDKSISGNIDSTFANLESASAGFKELMGKAVKLDSLLLTLKATVNNTHAITGSLARVASRIQTVDGTLGKLILDPSAKLNMDTTLANLKGGSDGLREVTKKAGKSCLLWGF